MSKARIIIRGKFPDELAENLILGLGALDFMVAARRKKKGKWRIAGESVNPGRCPPVPWFEHDD